MLLCQYFQLSSFSCSCSCLFLIWHFESSRKNLTSILEIKSMDPKFFKYFWSWFIASLEEIIQQDNPDLLWLLHDNTSEVKITHLHKDPLINALLSTCERRTIIMIYLQLMMKHKQKKCNPININKNKLYCTINCISIIFITTYYILSYIHRTTHTYSHNQYSTAGESHSKIASIDISIALFNALMWRSILTNIHIHTYIHTYIHSVLYWLLYQNVGENTEQVIHQLHIFGMLRRMWVLILHA